MAVSAKTYQRPRPASHPEQLSFAAADYQRQVDELQALAEKRFWVLYFDQQLHWFGVKDGVGRILAHPRPLSEIRGFFASQPAQA